VQLHRRALLAGLGAIVAVPLVPAPVRAWAAVRQHDILAPGALGEIVTVTLRNRSRQLADNMVRNNALLERLRR